MMKRESLFFTWPQKAPIIGVLIAQVISLILIKCGVQIFRYNMQTFQFVFFQIVISVLITQFIFKLPKWFFTISALFPVLVLIGFNYFHFSSWVYASLFIFYALTFSHTLKERVPLYLTNTETHNTLKKIIEENKASTFLDLGSGLGGVVRAMAQTNVFSTGVESAPLLWLYSSLLSRVSFRGKILRQNIWNTNLADYNIVYAFLSPAIMDKLYLKVKKEMKPGSLFISNSFAVNGIKASEIWELSDQRKTKLYFYKI